MKSAATEQAQGCLGTRPQSSALLAAGPAQRQKSVAGQADEDGLATPEQQQSACVEMATARTRRTGQGLYPQIAPGSALLDSSDALLPPPESLHFGTRAQQADGSIHGGASCEAAGHATQAQESCQTVPHDRTLRIPLGSTEGAPVATHPFAPQVSAALVLPAWKQHHIPTAVVHQSLKLEAGRPVSWPAMSSAGLACHQWQVQGQQSIAALSESIRCYQPCHSLMFDLSNCR